MKRAESLRKYGFNTAAERESLSSIGLGKKQGKLVSADAESGVGSAKRFLQRGCGCAKNFVAAGVAVLVVNFLEAMKIEDNDAQRKTIAAGAIQFLFKRFREEPAIVQTGERIRDRVQLNFFQFVVFKNNGYADQSRGGKNIHEDGLEGDRPAERVGEFTTTREYLIPELQALTLPQIQVSCDAKVTLEKLSASGMIKALERVGQELEIGIFQGQTRGHWGTGAGHNWVYSHNLPIPAGFGASTVRELAN